MTPIFLSLSWSLISLRWPAASLEKIASGKSLPERLLDAAGEVQAKTIVCYIRNWPENDKRDHRETAFAWLQWGCIADKASLRRDTRSRHFHLRSSSWNPFACVPPLTDGLDFRVTRWLRD